MRHSRVSYFRSILVLTGLLACTSEKAGEATPPGTEAGEDRTLVSSGEKARDALLSWDGASEDETLIFRKSRDVTFSRPTGELWAGVVAVGNGRRWTCTGFIVAQNLVATAKHCKDTSWVYVGPDTTWPDPSLMIATTGKPLAHPELDFQLLRLEEEVGAERLVRLMPGCVENRLMSVRQVKLVGYGYSSPDANGIWGVRREADVDWPGLGCYATRSRCTLTTDFALASGPQTPSICYHDSGSPVLAHLNGEWVAIGVTREVANPAIQCRGGGVFIRSSSIAAWAEEQGALVLPCTG